MNLLFYPETERLLKEANIPLVPGKLVSSEKEAFEAAEGIGFPVVLKLVSTLIIHKNRIGGVRLNIVNQRELKEAYEDLLNKAKTLCGQQEEWGILVQKMISKTLEVAIGAYRDKGFGPVLMFGLGGIFVEILKKISFRLLPLGPKDIEEMMEETRICQLLSTHMKSPSIRGNLINIISNLSNLFLSKPEVKEIDLNPVLIEKSGCFVADAKIILLHD
mgnify:CR=1 FL=1